MSPEHAEMEADWLAEELGRAVKYARETYNDLPADAPPKPRLALANLIGTLEALHNHYKIVDAPAPIDPDDYPVRRRMRKERNPIIRFFFGDGN